VNLPMKSVAPNAEHFAFRKALEGAMVQHGQTLDAQDMLALVSHLVGQLIALQDQRVMTADTAMQIVMSNIERGNREVIEPLLMKTGGSA
jgi:hypothetical protein